MLRIRGEQVKEFQRAGVRRFEQELLAHLRDFSPGHAAVLRDEGLLRVIRFGTERAARRGLQNAGPIRLFVELIFLLGAEFDTDPQYPWAEAALAGDDLDPMLRADRLYEAVMKFLDATAGPDGQWAQASLRLARQEPYEGAPPGDAHWIADGLARLKRIYPEKCDYLGVEPLKALLRTAQGYCLTQGVTSGGAAAFVAAMMFSAGHKFYADPHLPWVEATLARPGESATARVDQLYAKTMIYLDRVIADMPRG